MDFDYFKYPVIFSLLCATTANADMMNTDDLAAWETCALCHGVDGISAMPRFPNLAGQKIAYLQTQVLDFRAGRRRNDGGQMQGVMADMSNQDLQEALEYFARAAAPVEASAETDANLYEQGRLVFHGRSPRATACVACHGHPESAAPWLFGQHEDYLQKQLEDFRVGKREAHGRSSMPEIARQLTPEQIRAVVHYAARADVQINGNGPAGNLQAN